jgi:formamidopyrimidine-DNA glycosylase
MPEICEVVLTAQSLDHVLNSKLVKSVEIVAGRYKENPFNGFNELKENIKNKLIVKEISSKGKFLWFKFEDEHLKSTYLLNTFGLYGRWSYEPDPNANIKFSFSDNIDAYYCDYIPTGTFEYDTSSIKFMAKINKLAPDLLKTNFTNEQFKNWIQEFLSKGPKRKNMKIVKVLMSQNAKDGIGSGLGNYLVPEILYRSKISPHLPMGSLTNEQINILSETIKSVLKQCYINNNTDYMNKKFMKDFTEQHQQGVLNGQFPNYHPEIPIDTKSKFIFYVYKQKVDPFGNKVIAEKILGKRKTYWVPTVQL